MGTVRSSIVKYQRVFVCRLRRSLAGAAGASDFYGGRYEFAGLHVSRETYASPGTLQERGRVWGAGPGNHFGRNRAFGGRRATPGGKLAVAETAAFSSAGEARDLSVHERRPIARGHI